jgi:peroxiredoxin
MSSKSIIFFTGTGLGVALTLLGLQIRGHFLAASEGAAAQPSVLRPFMPKRTVRMPESSERLRKPQLPGRDSTLHDGWQVQSPDGKRVSLSELHGKIVFLNFWSAACAPCVDQMPGIERLYNSLKDKGTIFLLVTTDDKARVDRFLKENRLSVPIYLASQPVAQDLQPGGFPATFILNQDGVIVARETGAANWDDGDVKTFLLGLSIR